MFCFEFHGIQLLLQNKTKESIFYQKTSPRVVVN